MRCETYEGSRPLTDEDLDAVRDILLRGAERTPEDEAPPTERDPKPRRKGRRS
jgi:hypothetical protein